MIPTKRQIEQAHSDFIKRIVPMTDQHNSALDFMLTAALEKLDAMPFQPGEVVEWVCNNGKVANTVMVTDVPAKEETSFSGVVLKSIGSPGYRVGHHSNDWCAENFTRKNTNS